MSGSVAIRKKRFRVETPLISAAIVLFVLFAVYSTYDNARKQPDYTSFCTADNGVSLLFDSLAVYGFDVQTGYEPPRIGSIGSVQIIIEPESFWSYEDRVMDWVDGGGRLILAVAGDAWRDYAGVGFNGETQYLRHGLGDILLIDSGRLINSVLKQDHSGGMEIVQTLERWSLNTIIFNEYFHGFQKAGGSFWRDLPLAAKLITIQLVITAAVVILYFGKRFGAPIPHYEEDERTENEYIIALANLYRHAGVWGFVTGAYFKRLVTKAARHANCSEEYSRQNLPELWQTHGLKKYDVLVRLIENMRRENPDKRLAKSIIADIGELMKA